MSENIGEYNRQIDIEANTGAKDSLNQRVDAWTPHLTGLWAKIRGQNGMGVINAGDINTPINRYSFRVLGYRNTIKPGMRVNSKGVYYEIKQVKPDQANMEYTDLVCEGHD